MKTDFAPLIEKAVTVAAGFRTDGCVQAGDVGAAILGVSGNIFTGVCIDAPCGIGFCAEHAAVAEMLKARQFKILAWTTIRISPANWAENPKTAGPAQA